MHVGMPAECTRRNARGMPNMLVGLQLLGINATRAFCSFAGNGNVGGTQLKKKKIRLHELSQSSLYVFK